MLWALGPDHLLPPNPQPLKNPQTQPLSTPKLLSVVSGSTGWNSTGDGRVAPNSELALEGRALLGSACSYAAARPGLLPCVEMRSENVT